MSKPNSIVEVNGSRYDAVTGSLLTPRKISLKTPGKVMDGFTKTKTKVSRPQQPKAQKLHRAPQRSSTLMRHIVKRPETLKADVSAPKNSHHHHLSPVRVARAKTVEKHSKVNRFGLLPSASSTTTTTSKVKLAAKATFRGESAAIAPRLPSMVTSVSHRKLEDMLDEALLKADAHKQMMNRHASHGTIGRVPKWLALTLATVIFLAVAFWLVWQNLPTVAMHVAAARAHVSASMPTYTPSGYRLAGPIKYQDGTVTMDYKNDDRKFSIVQKSSTWNSSALQENKLANDSVQTSLINGTTVYVYGSENDAAWVNHGVMYNLKNDSHLSSDQIFKIVQSL